MTYVDLDLLSAPTFSKTSALPQWFDALHELLEALIYLIYSISTENVQISRTPCSD